MIPFVKQSRFLFLSTILSGQRGVKKNQINPI